MGPVPVLAADLTSRAPNPAEELAVNFVTDAEVAQLSGPHAPQIVSLSANSLGPAALLALGKLALPRLRALDLAWCLNDPGAVAAFFAAPLARSVRDLTLRGPAGGPEGVRRLATSPVFAHLESLEFSGGDLGDEGCVVLAAAAGKAALRRLAMGRAQFGLPGDASNSEVTSAGCAALVAAPALARLEAFSVALTAIDERLAKALVGSPLAPFVHLFPGSWATRREAPTGGGWFDFKASGVMPAGPPVARSRAHRRSATAARSRTAAALESGRLTAKRWRCPFGREPTGGLRAIAWCGCSALGALTETSPRAPRAASRSTPSRAA